MKKVALILILILFAVWAKADETKNYYIEKNVYYLLFCPNDVDELKIDGTGDIDFSVNSDIENSKNFITMISSGDSELRVNILTDEKNYFYNIISKGKTKENCDDTLVRLDENIVPAPESITEEDEKVLPIACPAGISGGGK